MKTVMLITIHGMGKEDTDYYKTLEEKLSKEMIDDSIRVIICPIRYAKLFQDNQNHIWDQYLYTPSFKLSFQWLRKFFLYYFSDAASVEFAAHRNSPLYTDLQQNIYDTIMQKFNSIKSENEYISVAIIAHSLGCQVMSN